MSVEEEHGWTEDNSTHGQSLDYPEISYDERMMSTIKQGKSLNEDDGRNPGTPLSDGVFRSETRADQETSTGQRSTCKICTWYSDLS